MRRVLENVRYSKSDFRVNNEDAVCCLDTTIRCVRLSGTPGGTAHALEAHAHALAAWA